MPDILDFSLFFKNPNQLVIDLFLSNISKLEGGKKLEVIKRWFEKEFSVEAKINANFPNKEEVSSKVIAYEIGKSIENRTNPLPVIKHYLKLVTMNSSFLGLKIQVKGRFKASNKSQKVTQQVGRVRIQSISNKIDYTLRNVTGKFGSSSVKVWLN